MIGALSTCQENLTSVSGNDAREAHLVGAKQNSKERDLGTAAKKPSINTVCNGDCFAVALKLISNVPQESGLSDHTVQIQYCTFVDSFA